MLNNTYTLRDLTVYWNTEITAKPFSSFYCWCLSVRISYVYLYMYVYERLCMYEGWNFNSGNYLFTTDTK